MQRQKLLSQLLLFAISKIAITITRAIATYKTLWLVIKTSHVLFHIFLIAKLQNHFHFYFILYLYLFICCQ